MPYLITLFSFLFTLILQYFLSIWLIKIGYFYNYAHTFGGFLILMIIYMKSINLLLFFLKIKMRHQEAMIVKSSIFLFLVATFSLNYIMMV